MSNIRESLLAFTAAQMQNYNTELITPDTASEVISTQWSALLDEDGFVSVRKILDFWAETLPGKFPKFLQIFERLGVGAFLVRRTARDSGELDIVLLYVCHSDSELTESFDVRIGFFPSAEHEGYWFWNGLSPDLQKFYSVLHDGILDPTPAGIVRLNQVLRLASPESEPNTPSLLRDHRSMLDPDEIEYIGYTSDGDQTYLDQSERPDLAELVSICRHSGSGRIMLDLGSNPAAERYWQWWSGPRDGSLEAGHDLWENLDDWLTQLFDLRQ
ncbi:hypothetical protein [Mycobacteroides abscessus]|uniref:hypothetical protein n=1 Tax=Mycobacteroides abscessus TaxID=36809 RepID=UPI000C26B28F|nr:hypothetical protein [Mycobacteroides abscessus]